MSLITHSVNEITIGQRAVDGYINATAMCQACGKQLAHYLENQTTKAFLEALSENIGIPILDLAEVKRGRNGGTWVHPQMLSILVSGVALSLLCWYLNGFMSGCDTVILRLIYIQFPHKENAWRTFASDSICSNNSAAATRTPKCCSKTTFATFL